MDFAEFEFIIKRSSTDEAVIDMFDHNMNYVLTGRRELDTTFESYEKTTSKDRTPQVEFGTQEHFERPLCGRFEDDKPESQKTSLMDISNNTVDRDDMLDAYNRISMCYDWMKKEPCELSEEPVSSFGNKMSSEIWEFLCDLLHDPHYNPALVRWEDRETGVFRLVKSRQIATIWGMQKGNESMNYEKFSRAMRFLEQMKY
ncbi:EHF-like protein [Mya arenaria]|uniref:EHF-like protein n=1 Tax=Mya arenaria TaxID=6604 RepID=A0ABY7E297_MYAAR|nr:EHF-like protein [Mya arenaria]